MILIHIAWSLWFWRRKNTLEQTPKDPWKYGYLSLKFSMLLMTCHLTLFLAWFSVNFRKFVMFYIVESVFLFFQKHSNFRVFRCNSKRNDANRRSKTSKDLWRPWKNEEWRFKMKNGVNYIMMSYMVFVHCRVYT